MPQIGKATWTDSLLSSCTKTSFQESFFGCYKTVQLKFTSILAKQLKNSNWFCELKFVDSLLKRADSFISFSQNGKVQLKMNIYTMQYISCSVALQLCSHETSFIKYNLINFPLLNCLLIMCIFMYFYLLQNKSIFIYKWKFIYIYICPCRTKTNDTNPRFIIRSVMAALANCHGNMSISGFPMYFFFPVKEKNKSKMTSS